MLSVNGKYRHSEITRGDLHAEFTWWGLRGARSLIQETLAELQSAAQGELPLDGAYPVLQETVLVFIDNLLYGRPIHGHP